MPIYEYKSPRACEGVQPDEGEFIPCPCPVEKLRRLSEADEPVSCSLCGENLERVVSRSNFVLKGSGWAKDGYGG